MELVIVTGLSGAGKSHVGKILEDIGYYCIDNMPPKLIRTFADLLSANTEITKAAVITDIRGGAMFLDLESELLEIRGKNPEVKVLFVDADKETVKKRYKETRRRHPLCDAAGGDLSKAIAAETELLQPIKEMADFYIDTTFLTTAKLNETLLNIFLENPGENLSVSCMSFGFKYGVPGEADLMFDVRCLPNPFYVAELKHKTGLDSEVRDFVMASDTSRVLEEKLSDLLGFLVPEYVKEGKSQLVIAFGCTGGKHRSVTFAVRSAERLVRDGYRASTFHRDIAKS